MLASKRGVCLAKLVLVPKHRQPGVQLDLTSSELPKEIQQKVKEDSVKKIMFHAKLKKFLLTMFCKCMMMRMIVILMSVQLKLDMRFITVQKNN